MQRLVILGAVACLVSLTTGQSGSLPYTSLSSGLSGRGSFNGGGINSVPYNTMGSFNMASLNSGTGTNFGGRNGGTVHLSSFGGMGTSTGRAQHTPVGTSMFGGSGGVGHSVGSGQRINHVAGPTGSTYELTLGRSRAGTASLGIGGSGVSGRITRRGMTGEPTMNGRENYLGALGGHHSFPYMGGAGATEDYADGGLRYGIANGIGSGSIYAFQERRRTGREDVRPDLPGGRGFRSHGGMGGMPGMGRMHGMGGALGFGSVGGMSGVGSMGGMSGVGSMGGMSGVGSMGGMSRMGSMGGMSRMGSMGGMSGMGSMGGMSGMGSMGGMTGISDVQGTGGMGGMSGMRRIAGMGGLSGSGGMESMGYFSGPFHGGFGHAGMGRNSHGFSDMSGIRSPYPF